MAKALAVEAGERILAHYKKGIRVDFKEEKSPVTQADRDANEIIVRGLSKAFPKDAILAEESAPKDTRFLNSRLWCVDPLDGTQDFISETDEFVVMIGLAIKQKAQVGVVYQPTEDRLFWATPEGAFLEQQSKQTRLHVSQTKQPSEATVVVSRSHRSKTVTKVCQTLGTSKEQPLGSVGLKVAAVALGQADAYLSVSNRTQEWDACAPEAILHAAGGCLSDVLGNPQQYNKQETNTPHGILATNGHLHSAFVEAAHPIANDFGWILNQ